MDLEVFTDLFNNRELYPTREELADALGVSVRQLKYLRDRAVTAGHRLVTRGGKARPYRPSPLAENQEPGFEVLVEDDADSELRPVEELVAERKLKYAKKKAYEEGRRLIHVDIKLDGPIGVLHFGDPHVDDDGTDLALLESHIALVRETEGLFGANVGDSHNNWVGRLARLYAEQSTSASEAIQLLEWFITQVQWLYLIGGNHDGWSGAGDPIQWIARQGNSLYQNGEMRLGLNFPNGREIRINARHNFPGHSMWNPTHGALKAATMGIRDHVLIAGHKHVSGYIPIKDPQTGLISHCLQVGSYKVMDRYAKELGLRDQMISSAVMTIFDPDSSTEAGLVQVFHDVEKGAEYLTLLRESRALAA